MIRFNTSPSRASLRLWIVTFIYLQFVHLARDAMVSSSSLLWGLAAVCVVFYDLEQDRVWTSPRVLRPEPKIPTLGAARNRGIHSGDVTGVDPCQRTLSDTMVTTIGKTIRINRQATTCHVKGLSLPAPSKPKHVQQQVSGQRTRGRHRATHSFDLLNGRSSLPRRHRFSI